MLHQIKDTAISINNRIRPPASGVTDEAPADVCRKRGFWTASRDLTVLLIFIRTFCVFYISSDYVYHFKWEILLTYESFPYMKGLILLSRKISARLWVVFDNQVDIR